jgi:secondary thiamine-phosphate synthase enzyme
LKPVTLLFLLRITRKGIEKMQTRVVSDRIKFSTKGDCDVVDITGLVARAVADSSLESGILTVFCAGATGAVTTTEFEPGCVEDLRNWFSEHVPEGLDYVHHRYHGDGNGHSHLRASLVGPSLCVPFDGGRPVLGTWQSIVFIDFDVHPRRRELIVQLVGA